MNLAPHSNRWLVVDDDPAILSLMAQVLSDLASGEVIACKDAQEAFRTFATTPDVYELLITDFDMPGLDGFDLAALVRQLRPQLPILLVSGHPFSPSEIARAGIDVWLPKPFLIEDLVTALRRLVSNRDIAPSARVVSTLSTLRH